MGQFILLAVIIVLLVIGIFRIKKEQRAEAERREREEIEKMTMPSGELVCSDDELLGKTDEEFDAWEKENLLWLINYVAYKEIGAADDDKPYWRKLFERLGRIKTLKGWW